MAQEDHLKWMIDLLTSCNELNFTTANLLLPYKAWQLFASSSDLGSSLICFHQENMVEAKFKLQPSKPGGFCLCLPESPHRKAVSRAHEGHWGAAADSQLSAWETRVWGLCYIFQPGTQTLRTQTYECPGVNRKEMMHTKLSLAKMWANLFKIAGWAKLIKTAFHSAWTY